MIEPVGVVALGLTVCGQLVEYYQAFQGQKQEVDSIVCKIEDLQVILTDISTVLPSLDAEHTAATSNVQRCLRSCSAAITELQDLLDKCHDTAQPDTLQKRIRSSKRRVLFPFRRKTLQRLEAAVGGLQDNVTIAIQSLQL